MKPRATYRLQFNPEFGFEAAADLAPYLDRLGVSHLYASPYLKARPGSQHGYDIVDHNRLNPELGDDPAFDRMNAALKHHGLGQVLDFVPNHVGAGGADNPFWLDVLEWGPDSVYAGWFDIDWQSDRPYLADKLLVPFLGDQYGRELAGGKLALKFDADAGSFAVWAYDTHKLPIYPFHYDRILGADHPALERLGDEFAGMASWRPQIPERSLALKAELASLVRDDPAARAALEAALARFVGTPGEPGGWTTLDELIRLQHWRAAHFRVAADDINYRRFFNINDLAGLRMELPAVFDHAHRLVFRLLKDGVIDGLRIDHVDGLFDPKAYLIRLRQEAPRPEGDEPFYLVVEKILAEHEALRADWPVDGTTGYEVTNLLLGVLVDPASESAFTRIYADFIGEASDYAKVLRECKKRIMDNEMASELDRLARSASRIARQTPSTEDFTHTILRRALREIVACFPVYRTYLDAEGSLGDADRRYLDEAIAAARPNESAIDDSVYTFLNRLLSAELVAEPRSGFSRYATIRCAMKVQQYSGPVMAKGLEDTAFYRYNRFIALNEVGGHPTTFGRTMDDFHRANRERAERWPTAMLGTSTHDTKRGEDARARLAVLSELPDRWAAAASDWSRILAPARTPTSSGYAPDRNDEYALLQLLLGTCPVELLTGDASGAADLAAYAERVKAAITKAMREAKVHTTWALPDQDYERAMLALVDAALTGAASSAFLAAFRPFALDIARLGASNSIVQAVLKLTLPGVPDIYQGTELWDLSMVDPDNRRPVDFGLRRSLLDGVETALTGDRNAAMAGFFHDWPDGRVKLAVMATLLGWRKDNAELFAQGTYQPIEVEGPHADHICAFVRQSGEAAIAVAVARLPARRETRPFDVQTRLVIPSGLAGRNSRDVLTARSFAVPDDLTADRLFATLPAAVLALS